MEKAEAEAAPPFTITGKVESLQILEAELKPLCRRTVFAAEPLVTKQINVPNQRLMQSRRRPLQGMAAHMFPEHGNVIFEESAGNQRIDCVMLDPGVSGLRSSVFVNYSFGFVSACVLKGETPMLLGRPVMESLGVVLDSQNNMLLLRPRLGTRPPGKTWSALAFTDRALLRTAVGPSSSFDLTLQTSTSSRQRRTRSGAMTTT